MNSFARFAQFYNRSFQTRPALTLALTNGFLSGFADIVAQSSQNILAADPADRESWDVPRTVRFIAFGVGMGPIVGRWNVILERNFPLKSVLSSVSAGASTAPPKVSLAALGKRVLADQVVMAPVGLTLFMGSMGIMEGKKLGEIQHKFQDIFIPAILANWTVWPFIQLVNFRYMPLAYRVPFQSTCGIFWTLYLSLLNSSDNQHLKEEKTA